MIKEITNGGQGKDVRETINSNFVELDRRTNALVPHPYTKIFTSSHWSNGEISIPYSEHGIENPVSVSLYIGNTNNYDAVFGGYRINVNTIILQSDIPYDGKVVIE